MKTTLILFALALLAGCAIVPLGCYHGSRYDYPSSYYGPPSGHYYGKARGYPRPGHTGQPGPRYDGRPEGREYYGHPDSYGYHR